MKKPYDYIDKKGRKIREDFTLSGKVHKINIDNEQARIDKLNEVQERLKKGELTPQEATKIINEFGRKNKHIVK